jgi:SNF2 family DNA or RNA helicase
MEVSIVGDELRIATTEQIDEPYLDKTDTGYTAYWHFIRDISETHGTVFKLTDATRMELKRLVENRKRIEAIIHAEVDPREYQPMFTAAYRGSHYQTQAVKYILEQKRVVLADDVGVGKTCVMLATILNLIEHLNKKRFVIVVPASLRLQWLSECRRFINRDMFPDLELLPVTCGGSQRPYVYNHFTKSDNAVIMIMSYNTLQKDRDKLAKLDFDFVAMDESAKIKSKATKVNKAANKVFKNTEYKIAATATPIENGLDDLYAIAEWVDKRRFAGKIYFQDRYCIMNKITLWRPRRIDIYKVVGYKNIHDAKEKLQGIYIRRTVDDVALELPEVIRQNIYLDLTPAQQELYASTQDGVYEDMPYQGDMGALAMLVRLQQICDDAAIVSKTKTGSSKLDEIMRLVTEDLKYQKVIIISRFLHFVGSLEVAMHRAHIGYATITGETSQEDREFIKKQFNEDPKVRVLLGSEAIQEGLNLQVASVLINVELPWNPAKLQQRLGRLRRIGSTHTSIRVINLVVNNTIEGHVMEVLYKKGELFERMFKRDEDVKIENLLSLSAKDIFNIVRNSGDGRPRDDNED